MILGEYAALEGGVRTATLEAKTDIRVAVAAPDQVDRAALVELRERRLQENELKRRGGADR